MRKATPLLSSLLTVFAGSALACGAKVSPRGESLLAPPCQDGQVGNACAPLSPPAGARERLRFAIVGDTRPASLDDTAGYPTAVIDAIFSDIAALDPPPGFVTGTGDYVFASPDGNEAAAQLDLYLEARARFPGTFLPAMGNHECTGATASNCGLGNKDGITRSYTAFLERMVHPLHEVAPYYAVELAATDRSWTSKVVVVAANAWDATQASWLDAALSVPTTYTFVVRHEPLEATAAPGTLPSELIIEQHPLTLEICGHTHSYAHHRNRVVMGNGGAPLTGAKGFGYGLVQQRADGAILVDEVDYQTGETDPAFHFAVAPDGSVVQ